MGLSILLRVRGRIGRGHARSSGRLRLNGRALRRGDRPLAWYREHFAH